MSGSLGGFSNLLILDFDNAADYLNWAGKHEALLQTHADARSPKGFHVYLEDARPDGFVEPAISVCDGSAT